MKKLILFSIASVLFLSCEKKISFEGYEEDAGITINGYLEAGQTVNVLISRSSSILTPNKVEYLNTAQVTLFESGQSQGTMTYVGDGQYTSNLQVEAGNSYRIEATAPNLNDVFAETSVPFPSNLDNLDLELLTSETEIATRISFDLHDPESDNYYLLMVVEGGYYRNFTSNKPYFIGSNESTYFSYALFDDTYFNGEVEHIDLYLEGEVIPFNSQVILLTASKEYFDYTRSYQQISFGIPAFFAQPVQINGNVENGFGIFGGYSLTQLDL